MTRIAFFNALGGIMWVTEDKVEEYKALGYSLVPTEPAEVPKEQPEAEPKTEKPKAKTATKKSVSKKK
jgi:hypothetical protein